MSLADAFAEAHKLEARGARAAARRIYDDILAAVPEHPGALLCVARQLARERDRVGARAWLARGFVSAKAMGMPEGELWVELGTLETADSRPAAARDAFEKALEVDPRCIPARLGLGDLDLAEGGYANAEAHFRSAIADAPERAGAWVGRAQALAALGRVDEADGAIRRALALAPGNAGALKAHAGIALRSGDFLAAEASCREALRFAPSDVALLRMLAFILISAGAIEAAQAPLHAVIELEPGDTGARVALGGVLIELGQLRTAVATLEDAVARGDRSAEAHDNLGLARRALGEDERAAREFEQALAANPALTPALANLVLARRYLCDFERLPALESALTATLDDAHADPRFSPFIAVTIGLSPARQRVATERWSSAMLPVPAAPPIVTARGTRLRVAYLSGDFHDHATSRLVAGVLEQHDKSLIDSFGVSYGPDDGSVLRKRMMRAFDQWFDARGRPDAHVAAALREARIDVLIDMKGHTEGNRLGILGARGAPRQIHWLGYPGTIGYAAVEGLVADDVVVPVGEEPDYAERILRLARCYLPCDPTRVIAPPPARAAQGLPESAVVLACFNQAYKITRACFDVWLDVLEHAPGSTLWLFARSAATTHNLQAHARSRGVDAQRIVFAPPVAQDAHLARLALADLALDTLPYGSHTTGVDALLAGVPLVTCLGDAFAGRVGASLVRSAGVPELTTHSLDEYRAALIRLAGAPDERAAYRERLAKREAPLFDVAGYAREFEKLLLRVVDEFPAVTS